MSALRKSGLLFSLLLVYAFFPYSDALVSCAAISCTSGACDLSSKTTCEALTGNLVITGTTRVDLAPLANLVSITGKVDIKNNAAMTNVILPLLTTVTGAITIQANNALLDLQLPSLQTGGSSLSIDTNTALVTANIGSLRTLGSALLIQQNTALQTLNTTSLESTGAYVKLLTNAALTAFLAPKLQSVATYMNIESNLAMTSVDVGALKTVGTQYLYIQKNDALRSLNISSLESVGQYLRLQLNPLLNTDFDLPRLTNVGTDFVVINCPSIGVIAAPQLPSITGSVLVYNSLPEHVAVAATRTLHLPALTSALKVDIYGQPLLTNLDLTNLTLTTGRIILSVVGVSFVNLPKLVTTGSEFRVLMSPAVTRIEAPKLQHVVDRLRIDTTMVAEVIFPELQYITGNGDFQVINCAGVTIISAPKLINMTSQAFIQNNPALEIVNFPSLIHVAEDFVVWNATKLHTLNIPVLTYVGEYFQVREVQALTSLNVPSLAEVVLGTYVDQAAVLEIDFPALATTPVFWVSISPLVTVVDVPRLTALASLVLTAVPSLQSVSLPLLEAVSGSVKVQASGLWRLDLPLLRLTNDTAVTFELASLCCPLAHNFLTRINVTENLQSLNCTDGPCLRCEPERLTIEHGSFPLFDDRYGQPAQTPVCDSAWELSGDPYVCTADGTWAGDQTCIPLVCPPGAATCVVSSTALFCLDGAQPENGKCCANNGQACAATQQLSCTAHNSACIDCPAQHFFHADSKTCKPCPAGADTCVNENTATTCLSGNEPENGRCCASAGASCAADGQLTCIAHDGACVACASNQYFKAATKTCEACPTGAATCSDVTTATSCSSGAEPENGFCCASTTSCASSHKLSCTSHGGDCIACAVDQYYKVGSDICEACPSGAATCVNASVALTCVSGAQPENGFCCSNSGHSCSASGKLSCTTHAGACVACASNEHFQVATKTCQACPAGASTCSDATTATACADGAAPENGFCCANSGVSCATSGKLSCTVHNGACVACANNEYFDSSSKTCGACPAGAATCVNANTASSCAGGAQPENGFCCANNGQACAATGQLSCTAHNGACVACASNQYFDGASKTCKTCPAGSTTCRDATTATTCANGAQPENGFCCANSGQACSASGKLSCTEHNGACGACASNQFFDTNTKTCQNCAPGVATCTATAALSCAASYHFKANSTLCCQNHQSQTCAEVHRESCTQTGSACGACVAGYTAAGEQCVPAINPVQAPPPPAGAVRVALPVVNTTSERSVEDLISDIVRVTGLPRERIVIVGLTTSGTSQNAEGIPTEPLLYFDILDDPVQPAEQAAAKLEAAAENGELGTTVTRVHTTSIMPISESIATNAIIGGVIAAIVIGLAALVAIWWWKKKTPAKTTVYRVDSKKEPVGADITGKAVTQDSSRVSHSRSNPQQPTQPQEEPDVQSQPVDAAPAPVVVVNNFYINATAE